MSALRVTRVRVNQAGVRRMLGAPFMVREMDRRMQLVRLLAIAIAPVETGLYVSRFLRPGAVRSGVNQRGAAFSRLTNDARDPATGFPYPIVLEFGSEHVRAQRILRRALRAASD